MKKMLAKAVALSLVLGGVGFVANDALAANIGNGVEVYSGAMVGQGRDVKTKNKLPNGTVLANQKDLVNVNKDVETNKANINTNKNNIAANKTAIDANAQNIATNKTIATRAYSMAQTEQLERKIADTQIREDMKKADKELSDKIDANAKDIATNKANI